MSDSEDEVEFMLWPLSDDRDLNCFHVTGFSREHSSNQWHTELRPHHKPSWSALLWRDASLPTFRLFSRAGLRHALIFFPIYLTVFLFLTQVGMVALNIFETCFSNLEWQSYFVHPWHGPDLSEPAMRGETPNISEYLSIQHDLANTISVLGPGLKAISRRLCQMEWNFTQLPSNEEQSPLLRLAAGPLQNVRSQVLTLTRHLLGLANFLVSEDARLIERVLLYMCALDPHSSPTDSMHCLFIREANPQEELVEMGAEAFSANLRVMDSALVHDFDSMCEGAPRHFLPLNLESAMRTLEHVEKMAWKSIRSDTNAKKLVETGSGSKPWGLSWIIFRTRQDTASPQAPLDSPQTQLDFASLAIIKEVRGFLESLGDYTPILFETLDSLRAQALKMEHNSVSISNRQEFEQYLLENYESLIETAGSLWEEIHEVIEDREWAKLSCKWSETAYKPKEGETAPAITDEVVEEE